MELVADETEMVKIKKSRHSKNKKSRHSKNKRKTIDTIDTNTVGTNTVDTNTVDTNIVNTNIVNTITVTNDTNVINDSTPSETIITRKPSFMRKMRSPKEINKEPKKTKEINEPKIINSSGFCYNVSYRFINKDNQEKKTVTKHIVFENETKKNEFRQAYVKKLKTQLEVSGMRLVELIVVLCETCHSKNCYCASYSFTNPNGEYKYYETHHFQNNDETLLKNKIVTTYYDKIKNSGGSDININVYFCSEEEEMSLIERFVGWLFFG